MRRVLSFYGTTVGKKVAMAGSGGLLLLFVLGHMIGNLKVYQGPEAYNAYAEGLREAGAPLLSHGELLWIARILLLAALLIHVTAAIQLTRISRTARSMGYARTPHEEISYASRTVRWGGTIIFLFVVYHLLHLTWGTVHPAFVRGDVYHNFVAGFQVWPVSVVYMLGMIVLGLHIYHGTWSMMQTLGIDPPRYGRYRRPFAALVALVIVAGNLSFPLAVLLGVVR
ncbi:MAG: succinate dehydrogenase cytochrome b subunit [Gemmatimonadota bacterium]